MKIERLQISSLTMDPENAKLHPAFQVEQIKKSIQRFGMNDPVSPAKVVYDFINKNKDDGRLSVKAGLMDGQVLDAKQVKALSELPSKEVLLSRLVGSLQAPVAKLVYFLEALRKQQAGEE